jgi:hypothetical protein
MRRDERKEGGKKTGIEPLQHSTDNMASRGRSMPSGAIFFS